MSTARTMLWLFVALAGLPAFAVTAAPTPEELYADRMLAICESQLPGVQQTVTRNRNLGEDWKKRYGTDDPQIIALVDQWLDLSEKNGAELAAVAALWRQRETAGWYDQAFLADKFIYPRMAAAERGIRAEIALRLDILNLKRARAGFTNNATVRQAAADELLAQRLLEIECARRQAAAQMAAYEAEEKAYRAKMKCEALMTRETAMPGRKGDAATAPAAVWDMARLGQAPAFRWLDATGTVRSLLYRGEPYQGQPTDVFAYYATPGTLQGNPALDTDLPAIVLVHGGGDRATRSWVIYWAKHGYAAISMDLAGCGPTLDGAYDREFKPTRLPCGGPGQDGQRKILDIALPITDQWPYHAVANVLLAHSLIRGLPGVNSGRIGVAGVSWGGYVTCIAAGVDSRFKAAMSFYGCGFLAEASVWKDNGLFAQLTPAEAQRWTRLWDPANYAGRIAVPLFAITGAKDFAYPLESFGKTYALPRGERIFRITPNMEHGGQLMEQTPEAVAFMDQVLKAGPPLPRLGPPRITAERITVALAAPAEIVTAACHYTTATAPNPTRAWVQTEAKIEAGKILAARPPADAHLAYFTATDKRALTVSSEVIFLDRQP